MPRGIWKPDLKLSPQSFVERKPRLKRPCHLKSHLLGGDQISTSAAVEPQEGSQWDVVHPSCVPLKEQDEQSPEVVAILVQK